MIAFNYTKDMIDSKGISKVKTYSISCILYLVY